MGPVLKNISPCELKTFQKVLITMNMVGNEWRLLWSSGNTNPPEGIVMSQSCPIS